MKKLGFFFGLLIVVGLAYLLGWTKLIPVKEIVIDKSESQVASEILRKLNDEPSVVKTGEPIARIDRRLIQSRLKELLWVGEVRISRNLLSGVVAIDISPRNPLTRLAAPWSSNELFGFMDEDLNFFYINKQAVESASSIDTKGWEELPTLSISRDHLALKADVKSLISFTEGAGLETVRIDAKDREILKSTLKFNGSEVEVTWGNISELKVKIEVFEALLTLRKNRKVEAIDISNPLSPVVR
jgi:cell division septal protein FtsQ